MSKGTIAVDFDGVIHKYSKGWQDGSIYDPPIDGVSKALQWFIDQGYEVIIFTTRAGDRFSAKGDFQPSQTLDVKKYLNKYNIPYSGVYTGEGKPKAKLYIDDRALRFEGDWDKTIKDAELILSKEK